MRTEIIMGKLQSATCVGRRELGAMLPLDTPFTCMIFPSNVCNFRCIYCSHSVRPKHIANEFMSWEVYRKTIDDLSGFPQKLKLLVIAGLGEPLVHPQIAEMVAYAKERDVAETVRIITNASLLTAKRSDDLIKAGPDHLKISLQGVTEEAHQKWGGNPAVPLKRIVDNVAYFYAHKKNTIVNVKIVSAAFESPEDEDLFCTLFAPISDTMNVEHIQDIMEGVCVEAIGADASVGIAGNASKKNEICQMPFYYLSVYPDGEILPCCTSLFESYKKISFGNVKDVDLNELWNSNTMNRFRLRLLRGERSQIPVCSVCSNFQAQCQPGDNIDPYASELIRKYESMSRTGP